jgi:hypothetical protein
MTATIRDLRNRQCLLCGSKPHAEALFIPTNSGFVQGQYALCYRHFLMAEQLQKEWYWFRSNIDIHFRAQREEEKPMNNGERAIADALLEIAHALGRLGTADASTPMGAIEVLAKQAKESLGGIERALDRTADTCQRGRAMTDEQETFKMSQPEWQEPTDGLVEAAGELVESGTTPNEYTRAIAHLMIGSRLCRDSGRTRGDSKGDPIVREEREIRAVLKSLEHGREKRGPVHVSDAPEEALAVADLDGKIAMARWVLELDRDGGEPPWTIPLERGSGTFTQTLAREIYKRVNTPCPASGARLPEFGGVFVDCPNCSRSIQVNADGVIRNHSLPGMPIDTQGGPEDE